MSVGFVILEVCIKNMFKAYEYIIEVYLVGVHLLNESNDGMLNLFVFLLDYKIS